MLKRAAGILLTVVVTLAAAELLCRWMQRRDVWVPPPKTAIHPYKGNPYIQMVQPFFYFYIPNAELVQSSPSLFEVSYSINSLGFRGPEVSLRPPAGKKRLLVIGDSMTEGHGSPFADAYPSLLDKSLAGWEVLNCGLGGSSPIVYALNLARYLNLHPDSILIVLYENDLFEDRGREVQFDTLPVLKTPDYLLSGVNRDGTPRERPLLAESRLLRFVEQIVGRPLVTRTGVVPRRLIRAIRANAARERKLGEDEEQKRATSVHPHLMAASRMDAEWEMTAAYLDFLADELSQKKVPLAVAWLSTGARAWEPEPARRHAQLLNEHIAAWASRRAVPFRSLQEAFVAAPQAEATGFIIQGDGHPTAAGHRFIAEQLRGWLRDAVLK